MNIIAYTKDNNKVRSTEDGHFSVYDVLVAFEVADKKQNAQVVLSRIIFANPVVSTKCSHFKFPGRGQRLTPVATEQVIYEILMLCPGKKADEFRSWAASLIADPEKALEYGVKKLKHQGKSSEWIKERVETVVQRHDYTTTLQKHGVEGPGFGMCTNGIYQGTLGGTAKQLKEKLNLPTKANLRDNLSKTQLIAIRLAEALAEENIENKELHGNFQCRDASLEAGVKVSRVFDN